MLQGNKSLYYSVSAVSEHNTQKSCKNSMNVLPITYTV